MSATKQLDGGVAIKKHISTVHTQKNMERFLHSHYTFPSLNVMSATKESDGSVAIKNIFRLSTPITSKI